MASSSTAVSLSSALRRCSASATAASLACSSSSLTRSACIPHGSPVVALHPLGRRARSDFQFDALHLRHQTLVLLRRALPLSREQRVELPLQRPHLQRLTARYIGLIRISSAVFGVEGTQLLPGTPG